MRWVALAAALALCATFLLLGIRARSRAAAKKRLKKHHPEADGRHLRDLTSGLGAEIGRVADNSRFFNRLRAAMPPSGTERDYVRVRALFLTGMVVIPVLAYALTATPLSALPAAAASVFLPFPLLKIWRAKSEKKAVEQAEQFAADLALYLRCGIPVSHAIALCETGAVRPLSGALEEYRRSVELGVGQPAALAALSSTLDNPDLDLMVRAIATSMETGSDVRGIMASVGEALRERAAIRRELRSQTVQGRLSGHIVAALPLFFLVLSFLMSRETASVLFGTIPGLIMLVVAGGLDLLGFLWVRKILSVEL